MFESIASVNPLTASCLAFIAITLLYFVVKYAVGIAKRNDLLEKAAFAVGKNPPRKKA